MGLVEVRPPSFDTDDVSIVYDRNSLHPRLKLLLKELKAVDRVLATELDSRKEQIRVENRTLFVRICEYFRLSLYVGKIYEEDKTIIEINRLIDVIKNQAMSVSRVYASNYYGRPSIRP